MNPLCTQHARAAEDLQQGFPEAGLINLGANCVTCIEARAESFIKTMVAKYAFRWDNVHLVMDDFHNADNLKYGRFDLAFAHGVYYHSGKKDSDGVE